MRVRNKPWAKDKIAKYPKIVIKNPQEHAGNWNRLFNRSAPIHLEIGTGKGKFVTGMAKAHPDINFIGIELQESVIVSALDKCLEQELDNVKLLNADARELSEYFAESEISAIYLNFSDPWPKSRHEKRRLTYHTFLAQYQYILDQNGQINLKTDNQGLFEYSLESFSRYGMLIKNISLDLHNSSFEGNVTTEYEEKFSKKGQRIYRCEAVFRDQ
ncbi:tRNA (guanosine(46)-N7)-methyltransferase TrmB [Scopulibacillus cellulosilyticus]|uniref:tRNA (guanine-N(7)-)-methyltransferase n=1 Tax=Scopulibacillus cellulosilyticus TaxID=2665665 RepID=A0ABW2PW29_9BACL